MWFTHFEAMEQVLYDEYVPMSHFVKVFIAALLASLSLLFVFLAFYLQPWRLEDTVGFSVATVILVFVSLIALNFRGLRIQLSSERLSVKYGLLNLKSITLGDIASCSIESATFGRFFGIGIRFGRDGSWGYITSFGDAIAIFPKQGRPFVFSSNNAQELWQLISSKIGK